MSRKSPLRFVDSGRFAALAAAAVLLTGPALAQSPSPYAGVYLGTFPSCLSSFTGEIAILVTPDGNAIVLGGDASGERGATGIFLESVSIAADGSFGAAQVDGLQVSGVLDPTSAGGSLTFPLPCPSDPASRVADFTASKSAAAGFLLDAAGYYSGDVSGSDLPFILPGSTFDHAGPFRMILDATGHGVASWEGALTYRGNGTARWSSGSWRAAFACFPT